MGKMVARRLLRAEVPVEQTWNLEDLFSSDQVWEDEAKTIEQEIAKFNSFKGTLHSPEALLACLEAHEQLSMKMVKVMTYASLKLSADGTDPENQARVSRSSALKTRVDAALSFISSEILLLEEGLIDRFVQENEGLAPFRNNLKELLGTKKYRLSPETEEALALLGLVLESPYTIYGMTKLADMEFSSIEDEEGNEMPISFALFENRYEFSPETEKRRKAYQSFVSTLKQYKNTMAATYSTEVTKQLALSRLRKYESVTHMLLEPQNVSLQMYHNQLDIIFHELAPHMRRFARLKKKILGLDQMLFCDLKAPLDSEFNPQTTYEEASKIILKAVKVMGPEYSAIIEKGFKERWVDLADNVGKSTGAFCSSPYGAHPYILTTWEDNMRGAFTLAHEFGHAGHFYLANKHQRIMNVRPSMYFIEAPSTMNELLLGQYLLNTHQEKEMRRWVILQLLGTYYHNFVTHLLEGEYQRRVYAMAEEGKALTANSLSDVTGAVLSEFWDDTVELDEGARLTWMRQPHYYMGLYPYTYSAGLTASTAVAQMIQEQGQPVVDAWLEVLKAGGTMKPLELLQHAGVDMSTPEPIRKAVAYVGSLVAELEILY